MSTKICNTCGYPNEDSAVICTECGNLLPVTPQRKSGSINWTPILIGAAAVVVIAAIIVGVVFLRGGTAHTVDDALGRNEEAVAEEVGTLANLSGYLANFAQLNDDGDLSVNANIMSDILDLNGSMDYSRDERVLSGSATYSNAGQELDLKFDFAADNKVCTLSADRLTADIYGFKVSAFEKKFKDTPLASLISVTDFKKVDLSKSMEKKYGKVWKEFQKTVRYKELNERQMQIGSRQVLCKAYEVTWDSAAATRLVSTVLGMKGDLLVNMSGLLKQLSPDCRFYVDEAGYVVAVDFVAGGNKCILTFEGEENIWDKCMLNSVSMSGEEGDIWGKLEIVNDQVQCDLQWEGTMEFRLSYADDTGRFEIEADLFDLPWYIDGQITSNRGGAQLSFGGSLPEYGSVRFSLDVEPLTTQPTLMGSKYVDLMSMDLSNWTRLFIDINSAN